MIMGRKNKGASVLHLVIKAGLVRVRKPYAPLAKPMQDKRRKESRRRLDHLADADY